MDRGARSQRLFPDGDSPQAKRSGTRTRFKLPLVLVVDDTEDNRDLYAMILRELGYEVAVAADGNDGVMLARSLRPSVIVMDLAMPNLDGFDATRQIRATPELRDVHIIAVTAFADSRSMQRAIAAGCDEVLTKPCPPSLLGARVAAGVLAHAPPSSAPACGETVRRPSRF